MNHLELATALAPYRSVPGVDEAITRLLGSPIDAVSSDHLIAGHVNATDTFLAVYLCTSSHFGLLEATSEGQMFSLFVPNHQIRRIALLEDPATTRLTIEINADRSVITGSVNAGEMTGAVLPGGYELLAQTEPERASLRALQAAFVSVV